MIYRLQKTKPKIFDFIGTNVLAVKWDVELTNKEGDQFQFTGVTVITLKFGKATHAKIIFSTLMKN